MKIYISRKEEEGCDWLWKKWMEKRELIMVVRTLLCERSKMRWHSNSSCHFPSYRKKKGIYEVCSFLGSKMPDPCCMGQSLNKARGHFQFEADHAMWMSFYMSKLSGRQFLIVFFNYINRNRWSKTFIRA